MSTQDLPETPAAEATPERCARKGGHRRSRGWRAFRFFAFVGLLVGVPLAVANAAGFGGGHCDRAAGWLLRKVDATDEQAARIDAVLDETAPALVVVLDRGPGVPAGERERIFEAFYRPHGHAEGRDGGVGLGLALVAEIARHHQGRVWMEPRGGGGSRFTLRLPRAQGQ